MTIDWPRMLPALSAAIRQRRSAVPPAGSGTTRVIERVGNEVWLQAVPTADVRSSAALATALNASADRCRVIFLVLPLHQPHRWIIERGEDEIAPVTAVQPLIVVGKGNLERFVR